MQGKAVKVDVAIQIYNDAVDLFKAKEYGKKDYWHWRCGGSQLVNVTGLQALVDAMNSDPRVLDYAVFSNINGIS